MFLVTYLPKLMTRAYTAAYASAVALPKKILEIYLKKFFACVEVGIYIFVDNTHNLVIDKKPVDSLLKR